MATDPREIQLTPAQQRLLAALSEKSGVSWPDLLSRLIASYQPVHVGSTGNGHESLCSMLELDGFLGAAAGGPSDMSTNPKYLEGFGSDR